MSEIFSNELLVRIVKTVIIIAVLTLIYFIVKIFLDHRTAKLKRGKKLTYLRLLRSVTKYILIIIGGLLVLQLNGIDTGSIVAGLGIASVIAGLALQDALKDIIMGFNILADSYFTAGDIVQIGEITGRVVEIGLKATKIKNLKNDNVEMIANRNISSASVVSKQLDIDIPLPYEEKLEKIEGFLGDLCKKVEELPEVEKAEYRGIKDFESSAISYKLRLSVRPEVQFQTGRDVRRVIKRELDLAHLSVPYQTISLSK